ncbi:MAG: YbaB/EbfC family nucleoid-associated protein [Alphaproteobacteria bacterium]|nr:YbaB/EbfC family nucleoid-associated protein [Alphaproteobacteria bacterium]TAD90111.1 MAG: YbaB/EbfC family nucleoid-associated protein [Alphaproteobacteria bacterium]
MKNLGNLMKQAQAMQQKMADAQARLEEMEVEGQSGGGMVKATLTGKGRLRRIAIDKSLCDPAEVDVLEDLILAAVNDAQTKAETAMQEAMASATAGLPLPPGMKLPF